MSAFKGEAVMSPYRSLVLNSRRTTMGTTALITRDELKAAIDAGEVTVVDALRRRLLRPAAPARRAQPRRGRRRRPGAGAAARQATPRSSPTAPTRPAPTAGGRRRSPPRLHQRPQVPRGHPGLGRGRPADRKRRHRQRLNASPSRAGAHRPHDPLRHWHHPRPHPRKDADDHVSEASKLGNRIRPKRSC